MERERRRLRALKKEHRRKELEEAKEEEKNKWLSFNAKAASRSMKVSSLFIYFGMHTTRSRSFRNKRGWALEVVGFHSRGSMKFGVMRIREWDHFVDRRTSRFCHFTFVLITSIPSHSFTLLQRFCLDGFSIGNINFCKKFTVVRERVLLNNTSWRGTELTGFSVSL